VVVLDEAAMTDDALLLELLGHAAEGRAKVVMVGDHRQLGAVARGGGFEALAGRYGAAVYVLADNVRQRDVAERRRWSDVVAQGWVGDSRRRHDVG
jgi:ATP-dependent exoDNAse (exonuclease V) alpha subunit